MEFYPCDFEANAEDAKFVSASLLIEFLHEEYGEEQIMEMVLLHGEAAQRRWYRWRNELDTDLLRVDGAVDKFFTEVLQGALTIRDIPCHVFSFADRNNPPASKNLSRSDRFSFAKRVVEGGESTKAIAAEANRTYSAVAKWTTLYRQGRLAA